MASTHAAVAPLLITALTGKSLSRAAELPVAERTLERWLTATERVHAAQTSGRAASKRTEKGPLLVMKVNSEQRAVKIQQLCDDYGFNCLIGIEFFEDLSDLRKALLQKLQPADVYAPCPCGSGKKYKFCCAPEMKNFNLNAFIEVHRPSN